MTGIDKPHETMNSKHILLLTACLVSAYSFIKGEGRTTDQGWITAIVSSANSLTSENNSAENELLTTTADEYPLSQKSTQNLLVNTNYNESYITARGNGAVFLFIAVIGILCIGLAAGSVTSYLTLSPKLINATSFFISKFQRDPPKVLTDTSPAAVDEPGDSTYYQADDTNPSAMQDTVGGYYLGCYSSNHSSVLAVRQIRPDLTVSLCARICDVDTYTLLGLQYGSY
ncbi:uncharacterized protein [Apostichopus japonicus]|uniref:uncharacterized protein isoform X3 n=1 Tax=Stichopus japonicus TaxID=307972 RepID=UPI003AB17A38